MEAFTGQAIRPGSRPSPYTFTVPGWGKWTGGTTTPPASTSAIAGRSEESGRLDETVGSRSRSSGPTERSARLLHGRRPGGPCRRLLRGDRRGGLLVRRSSRRGAGTRKIRVPLQGHFAFKDDSFPPQQVDALEEKRVDALEEKRKEGNVDYEFSCP